MTINKWNYAKHEYEEMILPDDWTCKTYSGNMLEMINCPHCGKKIKFEDAFVSLEFHTESGLGYGVCDDCYEQEWERRKKYKGDQL